MKLPRFNTYSRLILEYIGSNQLGVRLIDIEKYIVVTLQRRQWDPKIRSGSWTLSLYGYSNKKGLFRKYCVKCGDRWYLTAETAKALQNSSLSGIRYFGKNSESSITTLDTSLVPELSVQNSEVLPNMTLPSKIVDLYKPNPISSDDDTFYAVKQMNDARSETSRLEKEFDKISQRLVEAKAKQAQLEDNVRKVLGL